MTDRPPPPDRRSAVAQRTTRTDPGDPADPTDPEHVDAAVRQLLGEEPPEEQDGVVTVDQIASVDDEGLTGTEREHGYLEAGVDPSGGVPPDVERVDELIERESASDETDDPWIASDEGLPYVPPTDPVVVPDDRAPDGLRVAGGIGATPLDEPFDADHHSGLLSAEDEVTERVREALRADAQTAPYADRLRIDTAGGVVRVRGVVDDIEDGDAVAAVAALVEGVVEVRDETRVRGL